MALPTSVPICELEQMLIDEEIQPVEDPYLESVMRAVDEDSSEWNKEGENVAGMTIAWMRA